MRIGIVSDLAYPFTKGGQEYRYYLLARYLVDKGHSVTWFTMQHWSGPSEISEGGIKYIAMVRYSDFYRKGKRTVRQTLKFGMGSFRLHNKLDGFDVVDISQYPFLHFFPLFVFSKLKHKALIVSWYEYWGNEWKTAYPGLFGKIGRIIEQLVAKTARHIIVVSKQSEKRLSSEGISKERLSYVPNWIDFKQIETIPALGDPYDICYFGRLKSHKNVDLLLKALAILKDKRLVLRAKILGDGPERHNLERLRDSLGLGDAVMFTGRVEKHEDLLGYVKSSSLFVNPSTKEGGGSIVTLESNACGIPVIAVKSLLGIDGELIRTGENGFWAEHATPQALADTIHSFFTGPSKNLQNLRMQSIMFAGAYDINKLGADVERIYLSAMERPG